MLMSVRITYETVDGQTGHAVGIVQYEPGRCPNPVRVAWQLAINTGHRLGSPVDSWQHGRVNHPDDLALYVPEAPDVIHS
jgi:hypothetical protein